MLPDFILQHYPNGWLLCGNDHTPGAPISALSHVLPLGLEAERLLLWPGVVHHFHYFHGENAAFALATAAQGERWEAQIAEHLKDLPAAERWWYGTDVGTSSAALFAVLVGDPALAQPARIFSHGATPNDALDFGRCARLLALFPAWRRRLHEVAEAHPTTAWPQIVAAWDELAAAHPDRCTVRLRELHAAAAN